VWQEHAATVAKKLRGDRTGVFLVEGDPSLYGSFNHLHAALARQHADVAVEVIPGIPSPVAAAAAAGIPLATRAERIAIVPAASPDTPEVLTSFETVVVLKPSTGIDGLLDALDATGRTADAVWIRHAGMADEEIERDVRRLRGTRPDYFSLIIVRKRTDA
jgi:precorrin-2/cobalt-factor-2 C20-methyltransferase